MALYTTSVHEQRPLATGQQATIQVPAYGKIASLALIFTTGAGAPVTEAQLRAEVGNIRLTINGRDVVNASATQLLDLYEAMGTRVSTAAGINGVLELNLGRLLYVDPVLRDLVAFGCADVSTIQIQVTAGTLVNVASVQAVSERINENAPLGTYASFINYVQNFNATGDHTVDTLPRDANSGYLAAMIDDGASGTITFSEVRVNSVTIRERLQSNINALFTSNKGYAQPAGYYTHFFADGALMGVLPMVGVTDLRFINTFSVAPGAGGYNITLLRLVQNNKQSFSL